MNRRKNLAYAYEYDKNKDLESISALDLVRLINDLRWLTNRNCMSAIRM